MLVSLTVVQTVIGRGLAAGPDPHALVLRVPRLVLYIPWVSLLSANILVITGVTWVRHGTLRLVTDPRVLVGGTRPSTSLDLMGMLLTRVVRDLVWFITIWYLI